MKIRYYRPSHSRNTITVGNFGDELNRWLWPQLMTGLFDDVEDVAFFGIGSLLGLPKKNASTLKHIIIFGTGAAFAEAAQREPANDRWSFYCVRGPYTAQAYSLDSSLAITDPAILVSEFVRSDQTGSGAVAYMPHITEAENWGDIIGVSCRRAGVTYLDPRDNLESLLERIRESRAVIAEAMHGAIVADALRVPWIPVFTTYKPHAFKWNDWCASVELEYHPVRIPNFAYFLSQAHLFHGRPCRIIAESWLRMLISRSARYGRQYLSADNVHEDRVERLLACADRFRADVLAGRYS